MKIDLAFDAPDYVEIAQNSTPEKKKKAYPNLCVKGNQQLIESLTLGQEITAKVRLKVTSADVEGYDGMPEIEFDVLEMEPSGLSIKNTRKPDGRDAFDEWDSREKELKED